MVASPHSHSYHDGISHLVVVGDAAPGCWLVVSQFLLAERWGAEQFLFVNVDGLTCEISIGVPYHGQCNATEGSMGQRGVRIFLSVPVTSTPNRLVSFFMVLISRLECVLGGVPSAGASRLGRSVSPESFRSRRRKLKRPVDFEVLEALSDGQRDVGVNVAQRLDRNRSYINMRLPRLEDYELLDRVGPSERSGLYEITPKGVAALRLQGQYEQDDFVNLADERAKRTEIPPPQIVEDSG